MILVDTSVVIAQLRVADARILALFKQHAAGICGVTRTEVLYGVRNPADQARFIIAMNQLVQIPFPEILWDQAGLNLAQLRAAGLPVPISDALIATLAIHLDVELWARDQHFQSFSQ